jgi:phosphate transport system substrate-binding protein
LSGAFALYPMAVTWADEYTKLNPKVRIDVSAGGAGKGMTDVLGGLVDIGMLSRDISSSEVDKGAYAIAVTEDAVVPVINKNNPVYDDIVKKSINKTTLAKIYLNGTVKTWGEVVGRPEIKDEIHIYTRSYSAGAADTWAK